MTTPQLARAALARSQHEELFFATRDAQLAPAARAFGFQVIGAARASARRRVTSATHSTR